jgi:(5-formylfuran-3-yl)methyl phosphate synthase
MSGPQLLVSVRDAAEAAAALAGGADLIDIKEPSRGAMGRADASMIVAVVREVAGRVPVSAALGELRECSLNSIAAELPRRLTYVKWGLSGLGGEHWEKPLLPVSHLLAAAAPVAVAYADWVRAEAPRPADVAGYVSQKPWKVLLIDTFEKDGSTLLNWLTMDEVSKMVRRCQDAGKRAALAGSLTAAEIDRLRDVRPDWFAVRGAACDGGRDGTIAERRVRELADLVHSI